MFTLFGGYETKKTVFKTVPKNTNEKQKEGGIPYSGTPPK